MVKRKADAQPKKKAPVKKMKKRQSLRFQGNTIGAGPESKNLDVVSSVSSSGAGSFTNPVVATFLSGIAQGTTENQRIGRKVKFTSLYVNYEWVSGVPASCDSFRILVVFDKQTNGAFPVATDILSTISNLSPMTLQNADRFIVLHNEVIRQNSPQEQTAGAFYVKMNLESITSGTTNSISVVNQGSIYILVASALAGVGTLSFYSRLRFTDQ